MNTYHSFLFPECNKILLESKYFEDVSTTYNWNHNILRKYSWKIRKLQNLKIFCFCF